MPPADARPVTIAARPSVKTKLTLHVPAEAKVTLAGAETKQTGEVRTYATEGLKPGQHWDGYTVRVELEQNGKTLVEEKTLNIEGGKDYELSFEMAGDSLKVAAGSRRRAPPGCRRRSC